MADTTNSDFKIERAPKNRLPEEQRPPQRVDDPRERAKQRAAEILEHIGSLDEGTDEFYIDPTSIPEGWSYEWKSHSVMGQVDPAYQVALARRGWEPVPASRHPHMMPAGSTDKVIIRKGAMLMERPVEITDRIKELENRKARDQVRIKEQSLSSSPDGQFERNNKDQPLAKVKKSWAPIPVPD